MKKRAVALHLVEKGLYSENLKPRPGVPGEWDTGNWWISDSSAKELVGKNIHLHPGQKKQSHLGGEIISYVNFTGDRKRKIFHFRELVDCKGIGTPKEGWSNEKKIVWDK